VWYTNYSKGNKILELLKGECKMKVQELNERQLEFLKWDYFYSNDNDYDCVLDVPNEVIYDNYEGIDFVEDDFFG
jgi:hypothetical protein